MNELSPSSLEASKQHAIEHLSGFSSIGLNKLCTIDN